MMGGARLTIRVDFGSKQVLGPGKIRLLEAIQRTGSISQAGRSLDMSYRRAWLLVDDLNRCFRETVVTKQPGGARGGGAALTAFGMKLIKNYRSIETRATAAAKRQLRDLEISLHDRRRRAQKLGPTSIQTAKRGGIP
jgi:molybdate transport system regulatory protein